MAALAHYEAGICKDCGWHHSLTEDLQNVFTFEAKVCNTCKGSDGYARRLKARDDMARKVHGDDPPPEAPDPSDGRKVFMRLMRPDEVDEVRRRRSDVRPARRNLGHRVDPDQDR